MEVRKQPPPGPDQLEELPPEGWRGMSPQRFWMWVVGGMVLILCVGVMMPVVFRTRGNPATRTEAINNAKQIGQALLEFDVEFGTYPSDATAPMIAAQTGSRLDFSDGSSNAMFRQLIAFGIQSERIFFCEHPEGFRRPDDVMRPGKALEAGEVGFSYVHGLNTTMTPNLPLLATPMRTGTESFWNKPSPYQGKALIINIDNSTYSSEIRRSDGEVIMKNGQTLFDPANGLWPAGTKIDLRHPAR